MSVDLKWRKRSPKVYWISCNLHVFTFYSVNNKGSTEIQPLTCQPFAHFPVQIANQDPFRQQWPGTGSDRPGRDVLKHIWAMEVFSRPGLKSILGLAQTLLITTLLVQTCWTRLSALIVKWMESKITPGIKNCWKFYSSSHYSVFYDRWEPSYLRYFLFEAFNFNLLFANVNTLLFKLNLFTFKMSNSTDNCHEKLTLFTQDERKGNAVFLIKYFFIYFVVPASSPSIFCATLEFIYLKKKWFRTLRGQSGHYDCWGPNQTLSLHKASPFIMLYVS